MSHEGGGPTVENEFYAPAGTLAVQNIKTFDREAGSDSFRDGLDSFAHEGLILTYR